MDALTGVRKTIMSPTATENAARKEFGSMEEFQQYVARCHDELHSDLNNFKSSVTRQLLSLQADIQRALSLHHRREDAAHQSPPQSSGIQYKPPKKEVDVFP